MTDSFPSEMLQSLRDPLKFAQFAWPDQKFYGKQAEIIYSIRDNDETYVPAGNMLGKDYVAGYIAPSFFIHPQMYFEPEYVKWIESLRSPSRPNPHTVRVITTSVKDDHLRVLWGEINRWIQGCRFPLEHGKGGFLILNHQECKKYVNGQLDTISYLRGMVSKLGEGLAGHHAAYTLVIGDEASGLEDIVYTQSATWAKRHLYIGNPNPCTNWWREAIKAGDLVAP